MAELNFTETYVGSHKVWEATERVFADFCVRVVMNGTSKCTIGLSSVENGEPAEKYSNEYTRVVDEDFSAVVFPKYVTIRCWAKPKNGVVIESDE